MTYDGKQVACSFETKDFDVVCLEVTAVTAGTAYRSEEGQAHCQPIITE